MIISNINQSALLKCEKGTKPKFKFVISPK